MQTRAPKVASMFVAYRRVQLRRPLVFGQAGERDFRDFSCLPSVKENRRQPADPALLALKCHPLRGTRFHAH